MLGTIVNIITVLLGSALGMLFNKKLPERYIKIVFQGIGLFTMFLGVSMALAVNNVLVMIFSLVIGGLTGEFLRLESRMDNLAGKLKTVIKSKNERFAEGFVTAFLLFCMGSMTVLGAIQEGLGKYPELLLAKSVLDGFAAMALSSALGVGVAFSVIPLLLYQGGITLLTYWLGDMFSENIVTQLSAVGGVLLIGLGINILEIKKLKILNLLPALIFVVLLAYIVTQFSGVLFLFILH